MVWKKLESEKMKSRDIKFGQDKVIPEHTLAILRK